MTWVTEAAMTAALDAAARAAWGQAVKESRKSLPPEVAVGARYPEYDDLLPMAKHHFAEQVVPIVWAALTALPDPRYAVWEEASEATADWMSNNPSPSGIPADPPTNPYSSGV